MPAFEYQALDNEGRRRKGVIEADSPRGARALLRERGLAPLAVDPATPDRRSSSSLFRRRLGGAALALLTRELATLLAAGLPIEEALGALAEQAEDAHQRSVLASLRSRVREGASLATALAEQPEQFPEYFRASIAAAEQSGRLDAVLARLADYAESHAALRRRVWMALLYPLLLTGVALLVVAGLLLYVVPQVIEVFTSLNRELPWLTRFLIALSEGALADQLAAAHEEHDHFDNVVPAPHAKDVLIDHVFLHDVLPGQTLLDGLDRVAQAGGRFILFSLCCRRHALFETLDQLLVLAREEHHHVLDLLGVGRTQDACVDGARIAGDDGLHSGPAPDDHRFETGVDLELA